MRLFFILSLMLVSLSAHAVDPNTQDRSLDQERVDALVNTLRIQIVNGDYRRVRYVLLAANSGNGSACNLLGWMFDHGKGVRPNHDRAKEWFVSCANRYPLAAYNAGVLYADGRGVEKDLPTAIHFMSDAWHIGGSSFRSSMQQIPIKVSFYYYDKQDYKHAWQWAMYASQLNARYGKYLLGRLLVEGHGPSDVNPRKAIVYLADATEAYSASAAVLLSWIYGTGKFTKPDMVLAEQYAIEARGMGSGQMQDWGSYISADQHNKAELTASRWLSEHKKPAEIDFKDTLSGEEDQFK